MDTLVYMFDRLIDKLVESYTEVHLDCIDFLVVNHIVPGLVQMECTCSALVRRGFVEPMDYMVLVEGCMVLELVDCMVLVEGCMVLELVDCMVLVEGCMVLELVEVDCMRVQTVGYMELVVVAAVDCMELMVDYYS